jgi:hypothetical protein
MSVFRNHHCARVTIAGISVSLSRLPSWGHRAYRKGPQAWHDGARSMSVRYGIWVAVLSR